MRFLILALAAAALVISGDDRSIIAAADDAVPQATVYSSENCGPCRLYVADIRKELPARGWIVRDAAAPDAGTADVVLQANATEFEAYPTTIIRRGGREVDRIVGRVTPARLAAALNRHR